ncbi:hypothetical protein, partial [Paenibacillus lactis]|uniref:hypothetical protein n=1 Tax=Paenibacillus lactis TaxID=228574 RepID=UPI000592EA44
PQEVTFFKVSILWVTVHRGLGCLFHGLGLSKNFRAIASIDKQSIRNQAPALPLKTCMIDALNAHI